MLIAAEGAKNRDVVTVGPEGFEWLGVAVDERCLSCGQSFTQSGQGLVCLRHHGILTGLSAAGPQLTACVAGPVWAAESAVEQSAHARGAAVAMLRATSSPKATPQDPNGSGGNAIWVESGLHGAGR